MAGRMSLKFGLNKGYVDTQGEVVHTPQQNIKIYIDS